MFSKKKSEISHLQIQKESLHIKLQRENSKLFQSNLQLQRVQKDVDIHEAYSMNKSQNVVRCGSKTFFKPRIGSAMSGDEFEVIDPDELGNRTLTSASVGGKNAMDSIKESMRLNVMGTTSVEQLSDYGDELKDNLDDLPDNSSIENRRY